MKIKKGAVIAGVQAPMQKAFDAADEIWEEHGQEAVITEGVGGKHSQNSLHYYGYAIDLRTRYFPAEEHQEIARKLQERLGEDYDVVVHNTHIHVEWDKVKEYLRR